MGLGDISEYLNENWHGENAIQDDLFEHNSEMPIEENNERVAPVKKRVFNWKKAFTRELMRGKHKNEILHKYADLISHFNLYNKANAFLEQNDGLIGYFVVDVSALDDKFGYNDIPEFMRSCNLYAIGSEALREMSNNNLQSQNDGTIDGFLGNEDNRSCTVYYVDDTTGLPVVEDVSKCFDDNDERLQKIADLFLKQKLLGLGAHARFRNIKGKLPYLVSVVKASLKPKSTSNGKYEDLVWDYGVKGQSVVADSIKAQKQQQVSNISELKVDNIETPSMPEKLHISRKRSSNEFIEDAPIGKKVESIKVSSKALKLDKIAIAKNHYKAVNDNMSELTRKDYQQDVSFDNVKDELDVDVKELEPSDIEFDAKNELEFDDDELFNMDAAKGELEIDDVKSDFEISNKAEWNF